MITDSDVKKLKKTFATKDKVENIVQKGNDVIVKEIKTVIKMVGDINQKLDKNKRETDDILDNHERAIDKLNDKVFSTP